MLLWFVGMSILTVGYVFRDPRFDYRLLIVGAVLPLVDVVTGGPWALHSVVTAIVTLVVVMLATIRRPAARRLLLGLPIGMLLALIFDAAWSNTDVFWWPLTGWSIGDDRFPVAARGIWSILLELVGIAICVHLWRRNGLSQASRRRAFAHDGRLEVSIGRR